jgi:hypothetical protein
VTPSRHRRLTLGLQYYPGSDLEIVGPWSTPSCSPATHHWAMRCCDSRYTSTSTASVPTWLIRRWLCRAHLPCRWSSPAPPSPSALTLDLVVRLIPEPPRPRSGLHRPHQLGSHMIAMVSVSTYEILFLHVHLVVMASAINGIIFFCRFVWLQWRRSQMKFCSL